MQQSPIIQLETRVDSRIDITFQEYIIEALAEHQNFYGQEAGFNAWSAQLNEAFDKIQRRLGGVRYKALKAILNQAISEHLSTGNMDLHRDWIRSLLIDYYDPMYDYQFSKKADRVIFKGSQNDVLDFLKSEYQLS